jgi:hypothetical protein
MSPGILAVHAAATLLLLACRVAGVPNANLYMQYLLIVV